MAEKVGGLRKRGVWGFGEMGGHGMNEDEMGRAELEEREKIGEIMEEIEDRVKLCFISSSLCKRWEWEWEWEVIKDPLP